MMLFFTLLFLTLIFIFVGMLLLLSALAVGHAGTSQMNGNYMISNYSSGEHFEYSTGHRVSVVDLPKQPKQPFLHLDAPILLMHCLPSNVYTTSSKPKQSSAFNSCRSIQSVLITGLVLFFSFPSLSPPPLPPHPPPLLYRVNT